jgi:hypothetical protein
MLRRLHPLVLTLAFVSALPLAGCGGKDDPMAKLGSPNSVGISDSTTCADLQGEDPNDVVDSLFNYVGNKGAMNRGSSEEQTMTERGYRIEDFMQSVCNGDPTDTTSMASMYGYASNKLGIGR